MSFSDVLNNGILNLEFYEERLNRKGFTVNKKKKHGINYYYSFRISNDDKYTSTEIEEAINNALRAIEDDPNMTRVKKYMLKLKIKDLRNDEVRNLGTYTDPYIMSVPYNFNSDYDIYDEEIGGDKDLRLEIDDNPNLVFQELELVLFG